MCSILFEPWCDRAIKAVTAKNVFYEKLQTVRFPGKLLSMLARRTAVTEIVVDADIGVWIAKNNIRSLKGFYITLKISVWINSKMWNW